MVQRVFPERSLSCALEIGYAVCQNINAFTAVDDTVHPARQLARRAGVIEQRQQIDVAEQRDIAVRHRTEENNPDGAKRTDLFRQTAGFVQ